MLKRNIVANYAGTAWGALMGIAFVPVYVKYLGDEAYGVVGIASTLQAYLAFLDAGLTPMLGREMSRFTGGAHGIESIRSLLRAVELWAWTIGAVAMAVIWAAAPWIATSWLRSETLSPDDISHALRIISFMVCLRFIEGLYHGSLVGLQRQVTLNAIMIASSTVRGLGAVAVLAMWSPTLSAFFWWHAAVALATTIAFVVCTYAALPPATASIALGMRVLKSAWPFARGMLISSFLVLGLMQTDKILLSHLLELADFGRYTLALVAASCITMAAIPVGQAYYPRLTQLHAHGDEAGFAGAFHHSSQLVTVIAGTAGVTLIVFAHDIMLAWTRNAEIAAATAGPLRLLAVGNLLNGLVCSLYHTQLAVGWTGLANRFNAVAIAVVIPALMLLVPKFGMTGAAAIWAVLNVGYVMIGAPMVFRRLMRREMGRWYLQDLAIPVLSALAACACVRVAGSFMATDGWTSILMIVAGTAAAAFAAVLTAPAVRTASWTLLRRLVQRLREGSHAAADH